jgi:hypothetical protein
MPPACSLRTILCLKFALLVKKGRAAYTQRLLYAYQRFIGFSLKWTKNFWGSKNKFSSTGKRSIQLLENISPCPTIRSLFCKHIKNNKKRRGLLVSVFISKVLLGNTPFLSSFSICMCSLASNRKPLFVPFPTVSCYKAKVFN